MSRVMTLDGEEVQFVLNDMENINTEGLSDIIYSDGTRAILVNGNAQILQSDTQTVVLQDDDFNQYYINNENGEILIADEQEAPVTQSLEEAEVVQFIEDENSALGPPQIIYVNEEGYAINDSDLSQYQITEGEDSESILSPRTIKLETQVVDLDELLRQQGENETAIIDEAGEGNGYQYAILKDGKLHIQSYTGDLFPIAETEILQDQNGDSQEQHFDLSRITGRNLLTGQTVSLHNYMDKLQKKIKESKVKDVEIKHRKRSVNVPANLKGLLNKKLTLGKTSTGKRLVGKVIHVEKKKKKKIKNEISDILEANIGDNLPTDELAPDRVEEMQLGSIEDNEDTLGFEDAELTPLPAADIPKNPVVKPAAKPPLPPTTIKKKVVIQEKLVSKECLGHICRTLSGLMNMDTVKKKLQYKNIVVKVVERRHDDGAVGGYSKKVSYIGGHMQEEFVVNDEGDMLENWSFVLHDGVMASVLGVAREGDDEEGDSQYPETTNVTLIVTYEKNNHRAIRVVLNPSNVIRCTECGREFNTNLQLRVHVLNAHSNSTDGKRMGMCEVCGLQFAEQDELRQHRDMHVEEGKLFRCPTAECGKLFLTSRKLQRHKAVHSSGPKHLDCSMCKRRCSSESGLKRHLMTAHMNVKHFSCDTCGKGFSNLGDLNFHKRIHGPYKYYECEICKRTFSRHSNLQRHIEIHKGSEELYGCMICGCSYHYMSSLTRHVVQNHLKRQDGEGPPTLIENDNEGA